MSEMKKEGPFAIIRDKDGRVVHRQIDQQGPRKNWRQYARLMTNDGLDMFQKMVSIAKGEAFQTEITLPTGEKMLSEPMIPPLSVQKEAAKDVFELIHGKAVAATEVVKAEEEAKEIERVRAMSDDELYRQFLRGPAQAVERSREQTIGNMRVYTSPNVAPGTVFVMQPRSFMNPLEVTRVDMPDHEPVAPPDDEDVP